MRSEVPDRPHMVMLVGNHVVGDSRVLKAADSAVLAGYRVTIVGIRHRSVHALASHGDIPIYRAPLPDTRHRVWKARNPENRGTDELDLLFGADSDAKRVRSASGAAAYRAARGRWTKRAKWIRPAVDAGIRAGWRLGPRVAKATDPVLHRTRAARVWLAAGAASGPGMWRRTWPQIADYEEAFVRALVELDPDVVHVHDRHPLAAADTYAARMAASGRTIPWVYDAHEWLPGQSWHHPAAKTGWLAAEAELIQRADAVISVSPELAVKMRRRHALEATPAVVVNAPVARHHPMDPAVRRPLREECGLDGTTPLLVYVGRVTEARGVFTMVEALPDIPDAHMALVANQDPALRRRLMERASELGVADRLHIVDYVPAESVTWYVSSATVGVSPLHPTAAHHSAMPTKIREYLQAGLPIAVSDLRAQGGFVRETGVGVLHEPGDPASFAASVKELLADLPRYRGAVTPELLNEHTWENEEKVLHAVWRSLLPAAPLDRVAARPTGPAQPHLVVGPLIDEKSRVLGRTWDRETRGSHEYLDVAPSGPLSDALARWVAVEHSAETVVLTGPEPLFGGAMGSGDAEVRALAAAGKRVAFFTGPGRFEDPALVLETNPRHPMHDWEPEQLARYKRQVRRLREQLQFLGCAVLTTSRTSADLIPQARWVPVPVAIGGRRREVTGDSLKVLIGPGWRSKPEQEALDDLESQLTQAGHSVERARRHAPEPEYLEGFHIVVDSLSLGEYSDFAAAALGAGCVVVGDHSLEALPGAPAVPVVQAAPSDLVSVVEGLATSFAGGGAFADAADRSMSYATAVHDGAWTLRLFNRYVR